MTVSTSVHGITPVDNSIITIGLTRFTYLGMYEQQKGARWLADGPMHHPYRLRAWYRYLMHIIAWMVVNSPPLHWLSAPK